MSFSYQRERTRIILYPEGFLTDYYLLSIEMNSD
jgi:hypothetical protein